ncbi:hypothetical protein EJ05DRAFT_496605 [Pseudovirgaria hyperparasitica]|uniref:Ubiquitin-like domain-containing protein n=1 Tax=Pseudovirgaria hyperparasitica TaxID=470096 RepID=A0A6A6WHZ9_9PEZI|nr:uncharacterized protein EJ05DRAFT_496605 [Pseudovirgaria hyperparasitica]KAF2761704.1 hypothetical protein EJ05DRAFT_496605 [Pseudovirgaria hyperparasitica]
MAEPKAISIAVSGPHNEIVTWNNIPFQKILQRFCAEQNKTFSELSFELDGKTIHGHETPADFGMEDYDTIKVLPHLDMEIETCEQAKPEPLDGIADDAQPEPVKKPSPYAKLYVVTDTLEAQETVLEMRLTDSARLLYDEMYAAEGYEPTQWIYYLGNQMLDGSRTLASYGVTNGSTIMAEPQ